MATDIQPQTEAEARAVDAGRRPYRFSAEQFWKLIDAGVFPGAAHVELVRGRIYRMTRHEPHGFTTRRTFNLLREMLPAGFYARKEEALRHGQSAVLEPDVAVIPGDEDVFRPDVPTTSEAVLVVEVCASTRRADYQVKPRLYASAGVPVYWVVDVEGRKLDVFTEPNGSGRDAGYGRHKVYAEAEAAPVVLAGRDVGRISASDLLPPIQEPPKPTNPPA